MRWRLLIPLLATAVLGLLPGAAQAEWIGRHWTVATTRCTPTLIEGQTYSEDCPIVVEDGTASLDPSVIPTPPTGTVAVDGPTVCTLVPSGPNTSSCDYATTAAWNTTFPLEIEYSGDETHLSTLSYYLEWGPGYPEYPPEIPARAPLPSEFPPGVLRPEDEASAPQMLSRPQKRTRDHMATFSFSGGERYECALDRGRFVPSGGSFSRRVSTGQHALRLRSRKGGGPVVFRWRVLPRRG